MIVNSERSKVKSLILDELTTTWCRWAMFADCAYKWQSAVLCYAPGAKLAPSSLVSY